MKKTLAAVAILGAFAASASADVTVYGNVDLGLGWTHSDAGVDTVTMKSGMDSPSRVGFAASEKIGDVTVGLKFENSFDAATGKDTAPGFFNRETRLYVKGAYGEVGVGRFGALDSTTGPYALAGSALHAATGINGIASTGVVFLGQNSRIANTVAYVSPNFGGVTLHAQYASDSDNTHKSNRYYAMGARYKAGAFMATLVGSLEDGADAAATDAVYGWDDDDDDASTDAVWGVVADAAAAKKGEETKTITAGVSYDFGVTKALVAAQYFDNAKAAISNLAATKATDVYVDGYGVTVGAVTPLCGGTLKTQFGYMKAENVAGKAKGEYDAWNVGALYYYNLSKQTQVYGGLGYTVQGEEGKDDFKTVNGALGMIHKF